MASKHERTLREVFAESTLANIHWIEVEAMLRHFGCEIQERAGSRIVCARKGVRAVFHRPHPEKEAPRPLVRLVRDFCIETRLTPDED